MRELSHPNIVKLKEIIRERAQLYFVFEFMGENLYENMKAGQSGFSETRVRNIMFQCLQGLAHMHRKGYFHRDIKPENILLKGTTVKLADFGLAREIRARPPFTDYVSTRWYRAPEVLLRSTAYNSPVDVFAMGCVMAELFTGQPLFPGSSEADQIYKLAATLGTPSAADWPEGVQLAAKMKFKWPQFQRIPMEQVLPGVSQDALGLLCDLLQYAPHKRPSAAAALQYPFFTAAIRPTRYLSTPVAAAAISSEALTSAARAQQEAAAAHGAAAS